jgi:hypothetical protein
MNDNIKYCSLILSDYGDTIINEKFSDKNSKIFVEDKCAIFKINVNSDKIIFVLYDSGSGGNFLMNSLSLSEDIFINGMNKQEKILLWTKHLVSEIDPINPSWYDFSFIHEMEDLHEDKTIYFVRVHLVEQLPFLIKYCKNLKIIQFTNQCLFKSIRNCVLPNNIPYNKLILPINFRQFMNLSQKSKHLFIEKFNKLSYVDDNPLELYFKSENFNYYSWNVNWYLSEKDTLDNIEILYNKFGLNGFDRNLISELYNIWIDKMDLLKEMTTNQ